MINLINEILKQSRNFEKEAHKLLSIHEVSKKSRLVLLEQSYKELGELSLQQDELFREALRCIEEGLFRAAHVLAWAGFIDFLEEILSSDDFKKLKAIRPKWKFSSKEELRERYPEYQIIEAAKDLGLLTKNEMKNIHGLLSKRNECAHPSDYFPDMNETLGYISELFNRIKKIEEKIR